MKKSIKHLITAAILVGGACLASPSAFAQVSLISDDLYMGFENQLGGGTADYVINLGPASGIVGSSTVVNLSSSFSLSNFKSVLGTSSSMFGGVVAASNGNPPNLYVTQLRSGAGIPSAPGSVSPASFYKGDILLGYSDLSQLANLPAAGAGVLDNSKSWENYVEPNIAAGTFYGDMGINPDSAVGTNTVLYEDLWYVSNNSTTTKKPFTYVGYITLDLTGLNPSLTFTPTNAPASLTSPVIVSVSKSGSTVTVVSSNAAPTHLYQLQSTSGLNPVSWGNVGSAVTASGTLVTNMDTSATATKQFYRVQGQ